MPKTNARLQKLVDEIYDADVIADIGTDHGYLPIMAIKQNKTKSAYASDIATGPLSIAEENIKASGLDEKITVVLSDGLTYYVNKNISLDYVVIAGLGSLTISEILVKDYKGIDTYILCSNTEPSAILKMAKKKGLRLIKEDFFIDKDRKYWLIKLSRTTGMKIKSFKDIYVGMDSCLTNPDYLSYLLNKKEEIEQYLQHQSKYSKRYRFLKKQIRLMKEVLEDGTRKNS